jgi:hypothetical protein
MVGKMLNKIADLEKPVHRKIHHDEFCLLVKINVLISLTPCMLLSEK